MLHGIVQRIFEMYVKGYGYKKIAKILTEEGISTPKARLKQLWEEQGKVYTGPVSNVWNTASINHIINNDFYIGILRTNKYSRRGINGVDKQVEKEKQFVFEDFHEPIITKELFYKAQEIHNSRMNEKCHYRGTKKYANDYTGLMRCGDCGAPMFSISNGKRKPAYYCGSYHNHGRSACTSHHILVSVLDNLIKEYIIIIKKNADKVIDYLNNQLEKSRKQNTQINNKGLLETLKQELDKTKNELKVTMQQKIRDIMKNSDNRDYIEEMYATMENELNNKITTIKHQIEEEEKNNSNKLSIVKVKKDALKIFDDILKKPKLDKKDLETIIDCIYVYEDKIIIKLKSNIENIVGISKNIGIERENIVIMQENRNHNTRKFSTEIKNIDNCSNECKEGIKGQKVYSNKAKSDLCSNVVNNGDPLETTLEQLRILTNSLSLLVS